MIVDAIETKINIKKLFSDIPINEDGKMVVTHIGRKFKTEQTTDGTTLKPS